MTDFDFLETQKKCPRSLYFTLLKRNIFHPSFKFTVKLQTRIEIKEISFFMWYNGLTNYISKALLHRLKSNVTNRDVINEINDNKENETEILFRLPYGGSKRKQLVKHLKRKQLRRNIASFYFNILFLNHIFILTR